ncbi:uncharacterized protein G2W53_014026 [Senna tora]|uniref:Uncharacterized protein n=1 Tax=Senna tora TaxID=362788 RepID=A0A834WRJ5_9FABA|nr:uncharacterized protein G2W53_014026 [Senna tora]
MMHNRYPKTGRRNHRRMLLTRYRKRRTRSREGFTYRTTSHHHRLATNAVLRFGVIQTTLVRLLLAFVLICVGADSCTITSLPPYPILSSDLFISIILTSLEYLLVSAKMEFELHVTTVKKAVISMRVNGPAGNQNLLGWNKGTWSVACQNTLLVPFEQIIDPCDYAEPDEGVPIVYARTKPDNSGDRAISKDVVNGFWDLTSEGTISRDVKTLMNESIPKGKRMMAKLPREEKEFLRDFQVLEKLPSPKFLV